ncbi:MAG TPA: hypothetical protein VIJ68_04585 [Candidatus Saccharimonadales bacterium]
MCLCALFVLMVGLAWPALHATAVAQGDGMIVYAQGTVQAPRYRTLSGTTWSAESLLPSNSTTNSSVITRAAPTRNEMISGVVNVSGTLKIYRWDGTAWTSEWTISTGLGNVPRFDIAYEQSSGKAMVLYSRNVATTNELAYRIWDGTSWGAATNLDAINTSGIVQYVRLISRPGTDELAAAWGDANFDLSANYFDGANAVWKGEPAAALETALTITAANAAISSRDFDLAFEQTNGNLLIVWGKNATATPSYVTRTAGVGGAWGTVTSGGASFKTQGQDMQLASEPGTNYIAYANASAYNGVAGNYAEAAMWTGSAWANFDNYDNTISAIAISVARTAVAWVQSGGQSRAVVTYDDNAAAGVDWLYFNKNTLAWSAVQADYTGAPAPSATNAAGEMYLVNNPFNAAESAYITVDGQGNVLTKKISFDGTNLTWSSTEPGGVALEANAPKVGWSAGFAYNAYVPPPGSLGVDIVDGSGVSVASPSVTMFGITASGTCQTGSGALGTATQQIRVSNTTVTPGWTLSIAATAGATANWSSGTATYDFNDGSGSPAGCGDGADADSLAGQLSISPALATITPQSGCATTGLTKGSASAFNQGVTDNITLLSASTSASMNCYWDFTSVLLAQTVPDLQPIGVYSLPMTITVVAN